MATYLNEVKAAGRISRIWRSENGRGSFVLNVIGKSRVDHVRFNCPEGVPENIVNGMKVEVEGFIRSYKKDEKYGQAFVASKVEARKSEMENAFGEEISDSTRCFYYAPDYFIIHLSGHIAGKIDSGARFGKLIVHTENRQRADFPTTVIVSYYKENNNRPDFGSIEIGDMLYAVCSVFTPEAKADDSNFRYFEDLSIEDVLIEKK